MGTVTLRAAFIAALVAVIVFVFIDHSPGRLPLHIDGHVDPEFESVKDMFMQNFKDGWERGGASLALIRRGKVLVDLWGGYADRAALRKWKQDTLQITFSTTKAVASVCVAMLVDRGHLSYDDLVIKHWPEFGKHGKGNLTVEMLLTHQAGLVYIDEDLTEEEAMDHRVISKRFEDQKPQWPPGTASGYHIYSFGWLVDQLVRRADPKKRGIGQFVKEELHDKFEIDYHVGLPTEHTARVARLTPPSLIDRFGEVLFDPSIAKQMLVFFALFDKTSILSRALHNVGFLEAIHQMTVNNPDYWKIEQAAALGIGNARSLAQIFSLLGEKKIISEKTLSILAKPTINQPDILSGVTVAKGHGFFYEHPNAHPKQYLLGHPGHGCQQVYLDLQNGLALAYTTNALKMAHTPEQCRTWKRIRDAIYDIVEGAHK